MRIIAICPSNWIISDPVNFSEKNWKDLASSRSFATRQIEMYFWLNERCHKSYINWKNNYIHSKIKLLYWKIMTQYNFLKNKIIFVHFLLYLNFISYTFLIKSNKDLSLIYAIALCDWNIQLNFLANLKFNYFLWNEISPTFSDEAL